MKKFFKFGCGGLILLVVLIVALAMCSTDDDKPSTGSSGEKVETSSTKKETTDGSKKVDASTQNVDALGLKVGLGEIKITKGKIQVGVNVHNTKDNKVTFYPDQGSAVIGDMQLDANLFLTDGDVSGDIQGGVKKEAVLEFLAPDGKDIDVENVKEIKLMFGNVFDDNTFESQDVTFTVPVK
ncbi:hypothetical protein ABNX05_23050 [Lysinibacillus sp. M3]|uniref:DUF4352 domain-containing protein n=1 Tax=Lysinibacillus zambalensis TaxID=3160866 RepID=A0ABV1MYA5_9BACI